MSLPGKWVLPVFLLTILVGAMILGPVIYFAMEAVWPIPFHRAMDRGLLISALGALGLFGSRVPMAELWPRERETWRTMLLGYFVAAVSIQAMVGFNLALAGFTNAHLSAGQACGRVLLALVAALIAPPLEETVFRGFVQRELGAGLGVRAGLVLGAVLYMLAHFLKIPVELDHEPVHLWSGATAVGAAFANFGHDLFLPQNIGKEANLLLIGLILGGIYLRSGSLWMNAALHSGWIFGLLIFTGFTRPVVPPYELGSRAWQRARDWGECALGLAFPWPESTEPEPVRVEAPFCRQCGQPYPALEGHSGDFTCNDCVKKTWHFDWARSGYRTEGQVREAVLGYKYEDQYYQESRLVDWLTETYDRHAGKGWDALVPVPLYHRRHRERGFNQAKEIASGLALRRKIPVLNCLYRYRETVSQTKLDRNARWENMSGAFQMKRGFDVTGRNLLVIDDVFTTGATVNACAQALVQAGAGRLAVLTIARS